MQLFLNKQELNWQIYVRVRDTIYQIASDARYSKKLMFTLVNNCHACVLKPQSVTELTSSEIFAIMNECTSQ